MIENVAECSKWFDAGGSDCAGDDERIGDDEPTVTGVSGLPSPSENTDIHSCDTTVPSDDCTEDDDRELRGVSGGRIHGS